MAKASNSFLHHRASAHYEESQYSKGSALANAIKQTYVVTCAHAFAGSCMSSTGTKERFGRRNPPKRKPFFGCPSL